MNALQAMRYVSAPGSRLLLARHECTPGDALRLGRAAFRSRRLQPCAVYGLLLSHGKHPALAQSGGFALCVPQITRRLSQHRPRCSVLDRRSGRLVAVKQSSETYEKIERDI